MAETKRNDKLTLTLDPRLIARVEEYAEQAGTGVDYAVSDLLTAGLQKQQRTVRGRKVGRAGG